MCCCIDVFLVHWDRREYNKNLLITTRNLYFNEKIVLLCLKVIRLLVKCCKICISSSILRFHSVNILQSPYDIMKTNTVINIQTSCCHKYCSFRNHLKTIFVFCLLIKKTSVWWRCFYPLLICIIYMSEKYSLFCGFLLSWRQKINLKEILLLLTFSMK